MNSSTKRILIVSLNAAVDRIINVPRLDLGAVHRTSDSIAQAGGKAINAARALTSLGCCVFVLGFAGGPTGEEIRLDLHESRIPSLLIPIQNRSRSCYIIVDRSTGEQTVINETGPEISVREFELFFGELKQRLEEAELLICSGSLPLGVDASCYGQFVNLASERGLRTLVDASGEALRLALAAKPYLVKPNRDEAEQLLGTRITDGGLDAARRIRENGATVGLVSLGAKGAAAVWDRGEILVRAPQISVVNAVASGDAFLAGCAAALLEKLSPADMIKWGVAAGSANALVGGARITRAEFERLRAEIAKI